MRDIFGKAPLPTVFMTRQFNHINGRDAEVRAAAALVVACHAEVAWSSRAADGLKIDLLLSAEHPWTSGEQLLVLVQVKSGDTYGEELLSNGFVLKGSAVKLAQRTTHNVCVAWVNPTTGHCFWAYVHPHSRRGKHSYGILHKISPATYYDITRCAMRFGNGDKHAAGICVSDKGLALKAARRRAKRSYRATKSVQSPVMGDILLTRLGWRHMFRASRRLKWKMNSTTVIPYLSAILQRIPSAHYITKCEESVFGQIVVRNAEHVLRFGGMSVRDAHGMLLPATAVVRLQESIRYPEDWQLRGVLTQQIERRVVLVSAYLKID